MVPCVPWATLAGALSRGERLTGFRSADLCVSTRVPDVCEHDDGIVVIRFRRHFLWVHYSLNKVGKTSFWGLITGVNQNPAQSQTVTTSNTWILSCNDE